MPETKIVQFPGSGSVGPSVRTVEPTLQLGLFGPDNDDRGRIAFLDIRWLVEDTLFAMVVRNSVRSLIDLRQRPVFDRPHFRHRNVVHYLYERNIAYFEYAMLTRGAQRVLDYGRTRREDSGERFNELLTKGLTICLYDESAKAVGWLDDARHFIRLSSAYRAEMHPRALGGLPHDIFDTAPF